MIKLLFFSFRLIFATTQPSTQDSASANSEMTISSTTPPRMIPAVRGTVHQYTMMTGKITMPEYISPSR